jgi:hypothetical protein
MARPQCDIFLVGYVSSNYDKTFMCCVSSDLGKRYGIKCGAIGCTIGNLSGNMVGIVPKSTKKKI